MRLLSVVIPAYNRADLLARCVERFGRQTLSPEDFELVIVDDGSPSPISSELEGRIEAPVRVLRQDNRGPAAARNFGVRESQGVIVVFIGDDVLVPPDFLEKHLRWHQGDHDPMHGMLGRADWPEELLDDPYMRWLDRSGLQFGYAGLQLGQKLEYYHFYTSNISIKRETLVKFPFDEDFRDAAWEDTDLGLRLIAEGFELYFEPDCRAEHHHHYSLEASCIHRRRVGRAARTFERKHPDKFRTSWMKRYPTPVRWLLESDMVRQLGGERVREMFYRHANAEAFWQGYREGTQG